MGNTPSSHQHGQASPHHRHPDDESSSSSSHHQHHHHHRHPNLKLPMPSRPTHISPQSSNPTSPSGGRSGSPRRRKSLELPDLNKLSFTPSALTPAAPVPTTHTHTSHHLAPSTSAITSSKTSPQSSVHGSAQPGPPAAGASAPGPTKRWQHTLGGRASPLTNANALGAMSKLDNNVNVSVSAPPRSAPIAMPNTNIQHRDREANDSNPYFPTTAAQDAAAAKSIPIPIPGKDLPLPAPSGSSRPTGLSPPPPTKAPTPLPPNAGATTAAAGEQPLQPVDDGMVNVPVHWTGGGKTVYVTGNFADNWKGRIKLHRSTHDFNTILRLPPGQYRLKFIVDDSWRCSKQISTAVDDDGTLVNWIEVETPKTEEEMRAEWAMDAKPAVKEENVDESAWTTTIPPALTLYQYIEELPTHFSPEEYSSFLKSVPYLPNVPPPPTLPRILDKVIVNNDSKRLWDSHDPSMAQQTGYSAPATLDDNSILAVPNHVVLNHLTASAIRNGTLGVGTTTRYRKKYITTMFFKPTLADMPGTQSVTENPSQIPSESISQAQSVQ
ncbi:uncharacterized protein I303_101550 [Kwoniella dejecticola CBS 10117]|uniref:Association with the SNF1 complex (ASC) domain-containing protein n=1 Tax=Kwoniella dejecticola CBS 10117 TaxID=1296121 RepID=A0A1A6ADI1_9TREE|nr:uncharacterized protein I303_02318 [Kwoniella dejecticola CBS 10117]OBR88099.1 hypothetical protein I303_02318 [Kwoniella dejecticola CBS 10117]